MSSNPSLGIEFHPIGSKNVISELDGIAFAGANLEKASKKNASAMAKAYGNSAAEIAKTFAMYHNGLAERNRLEAQAARNAEQESRRRIQASRQETDQLIADGKRVLAAQRQIQLAMESRISNKGGYGPNLPSMGAVGPSKDLFLANQARVANEKSTLDLMLAARDNHERNVSRRNAESLKADRAYEQARIVSKKQSIATEIELGREQIARVEKANRDRRAQLNLENKVANAGGYGPNLPSAPAPVAQQASALNTGLVNAAAFLTVATRAYHMASQAVGVISGFVTEAAKWEAMEMGLRNLEGSAQGAAQATEHLYELAKAPAIELATATKAYLQLRALHMAGSDAERVIRNISNTIARSGGGSVEFERVLRQMTQMLAKGKVLEQDLRIMKEAMPELATLMQTAFGETTAEGIRKQGVNAKQFVETMLAEMEKLPKAQQTLQSEIENTGVAWSRLKAAFVDTDWTKDFLSSWTTSFEILTNLIKAKSVDWSGMIRAAMRGEMGSPDQFITDSPEQIRKKAERDIEREYARKQFEDRGVGRYFGATLSELWRGESSEGYDPSIKTKIAGLTYNERLRLLNSNQTNFSSADRAYTTQISSPNSEGVAAGKSGTEEGKKKTTSSTDKDLGWNDPKRVSSAKDYAKNLQKIETERRERSAKEFREAEDEKLKYKLAEQKADKDHQSRVDAWNQRQIDKNREKNQEQSAYSAKSNKYANIDFEFNAENDKILELFKNNEEEMTRQLEINLSKRNQMRREAEREDYVQGLTGASQLSNSLAENIKARIDYSYNAKKSAIEKEYALAERAGTATEAMRKAKDNALADLDKRREEQMKGSYATMFRIVKSFEIATAAVQLAAAALNAMNDKTAITVGQKFANVGLVMAAGANLVSQITSATYSGYFDKGGYIPRGGWGIAGENGPEIIQGPAHVTSTRDTARLIGSGGGAPTINVNNYAGVAVSTKSNRDGSVDILIQRAAEVAEERIASGIASGGGKVSQQITRTFGVKR